MECYYYDIPEEGLRKQPWDRDLHTLIKLRWTGVSKFCFPFSGNWLHELTVAHEEGVIVTSFTEQDSGLSGFVHAEGMAVILAEDPPTKFRDALGESLDHWIVRSG